MKLPVLNKVMFIYKFHYFFFQAGIAPAQTAMPVYAQTLGFSSFVVGTIYTILPLLGLVIKPALGALADRFKLHKAVMLASAVVIMLSYFCVQFIPSDFTPPIRNQTRALEMFCENDVSLYMCAGNNYESPYLISVPKDTNVSCSVKCQLSPKAWLNLCQTTRTESLCSSPFQQPAEYPKEECHQLPAFLTAQGASPYCVEARRSSSCHVRCGGRPDLPGWAKETDEDDDEYQDDSITFGQYQFYVFIVLMVGSFAGTAVTTTLSDTICITNCEDPNAYGKQRLWGSIGYGVLSIVIGLVMDNITGPGEPKNYLPAFYTTLVVMLFDIVVAYFYIEVQITQKSESIAKDVWKMLLNVRVLVFLVWCAAMGVSMGLTWTFLYWLLEDLAKSTGPDTVDSIKTIEGLTNGVQTFLGETPAFFFAGWVLTKIGHGHAMSVILLTIGIRFTIYSFLSNPWYVLFVEPLQLYYGLFYSTMTSYANLVAAPGTEATVQSLMCAVCEGIGVAIGSFLGGIFYDKYGGLTCFRIFGISFLVMAVMNECIEFIYRRVDSKKDKLPVR